MHYRKKNTEGRKWGKITVKQREILFPFSSLLMFLDQESFYSLALNDKGQRGEQMERIIISYKEFLQ